MFDPTKEPLIPLCRVPTLSWIPHRRRGRPLHPSTVFRWARGVRGVRLEVVRLGGTLCTSECALVRFFEAMSATTPRKKGATDGD